MQTRYVPEDRFPMQESPGVQMIGNYYFNLMLITGKEKTLLCQRPLLNHKFRRGLQKPTLTSLSLN